jgi:DNA-binding CsgD family transcriptional regulator/ArsR family metal-binding transcriptional regulator
LSLISSFVENERLRKMLIQDYSDFSISKVGMMFGARWSAHFKLDNDASQLFPYINAHFHDAKYYDRPEHIEFDIETIRCTLYPKDVIAASFFDKDQALRFVKRFIDFLNNLYTKRDSLKPNYKRFRPVSVLDLYKLLPQTNCRECGFSTCLAFAGALRNGKTNPHQCPGFSKPIYGNAVYAILDEDGNLASTVAIDIDTKIVQNSESKQKKNTGCLGKRSVQENQKLKAISKNNNMDLPKNLTAREIEVLCLVAEGSTNPEIADKLSISSHTVKHHVVHILNKIGVNDRTQAAVWAARHGII